MSTDSKELTRPQARMLKRLTAFRARWDRATATMSKLEADRGELFAQARELDGGPLTFKQIADAMGVTEAAVQQRLMKRRRDANGD